MHSHDEHEDHDHLGHEHHHHIPTTGILRLKEKEHLADNIWAFRFTPGQPLSWTPGQFIRIEIPHDNPDKEGTKRWFTISSTPHDGFMQITTRITFSSQYELAPGRSEKLFSVCKALDADVYVSGPAAKNYLDESVFNEQGMQVEWFDYGEYPSYPQVYPPFEHALSILDLILNVGPDATQYMNSFKMKSSIK